MCSLEHERAAGEIFRTSTRQPGREDTLIEEELRPGETPPLAQRDATLGFVGANNLTRLNETDIDNTPRDGGIRESSSSQEAQENPMVEDFDDSANALWLLYGKEAKGYDEATIQSIKDDMDGVLIFVRITFHSLLGVCPC
jgi:hypothetical protein